MVDDGGAALNRNVVLEWKQYWKDKNERERLFVLIGEICKNTGFVDPCERLGEHIFQEQKVSSPRLTLCLVEFLQDPPSDLSPLVEKQHFVVASINILPPKRSSESGSETRNLRSI